MKICTKYENKVDRPRYERKICTKYENKVDRPRYAAFEFKTGNDRWDDMHAALGTDRATIESIVKIYADPVRHGNWGHAKRTDSSTRWKMLLLTRDILLKYLEHELPNTLKSK